MEDHTEIGGYFSIELALRKEYHESSIHLNSGRAALWYILKARRYNKIYLPAYL